MSARRGIGFQPVAAASASYNHRGLDPQSAPREPGPPCPPAACPSVTHRPEGRALACIKSFSPAGEKLAEGRMRGVPRARLRPSPQLRAGEAPSEPPLDTHPTTTIPWAHTTPRDSPDLRVRPLRAPTVTHLPLGRTQPSPARSLMRNSSRALGCRDTGYPGTRPPTTRRKPEGLRLTGLTPHDLRQPDPACNRTRPIRSPARERHHAVPQESPRRGKTHRRVRTPFSLQGTPPSIQAFPSGQWRLAVGGNDRVGRRSCQAG